MTQESVLLASGNDVQNFPFRLIRRRNKRSVSIQVTADGEVKVSAPTMVSAEEVQRIVLRKSEWIKRQIRLREETRKMYPNKTFQNGEIYYFKGIAYQLSVCHSTHPFIIVDAPFLKIGVDDALSSERTRQIRQQLCAWYQFHAEKHFNQRVEFYQSRIRKPLSVHIKDQKSKWGSCTSRGKIYLNWKLIMAPEHIIDYVIVHELCHLIHLNHSRAYWRIVQLQMPNFLECRNWLRLNDRMLDF